MISYFLQKKIYKNILIGLIIISCLFFILISFKVAGVFKPLKETRVFPLNNSHSGNIVEADLKTKGKFVNIWLDRSEKIPQNKLKSLINTFDNHIFPVSGKLFSIKGNEYGKTNILITDTADVNGFFDPKVDSKLIYINSRLIKKQPTNMYKTLARQLAHRFFYLNNGPDLKWLNEGLAAYSEYLNQRHLLKLKDKTKYQNGYYGNSFSFIDISIKQVKLSKKSVSLFVKDLLKKGGDKKELNHVLIKYINNKRYNSKEKIDNSINKRYSSMKVSRT